jgi:uncharacterized DUF497 family protein
LWRRKSRGTLPVPGPTSCDWDKGNRENCTRHSISLAEIERLLSGNPRVAPDLVHSDLEDRRIAVGRNHLGRPMFVAFNLRVQDGRQPIRPITARCMHAKEARAYEA